MVSIISSANRGTASIFDLVTDISTMASQTVRVGSRAIDSLDLKARELHEGVRSKSLSNIVIIKDREIMNAAREYVDLLEENYRYITGLDNFNRVEEYAKVVSKMELALEEG